MIHGGRAAVVLLLLLPALVDPAPTGLAPVWALACTALALGVLLRAQVRLLGAHLAVSTRSLWHDAGASSLAAAAGLVVLFLPALQLRTGVSEPTGVLALAGLALAVVSAGTATSTVLLALPRSDPRVGWSVAVGVLALVTALVLLLRPPPAAVALPGALAWGAVLLGAVSAQAPRHLHRHRAPWDKDLVSLLVGGAVAAAVLLAGDLRGVPVAAALMAAAALALLGAKVPVLVRELVALQGSHEAALTDDLTGLGNRRRLLAELEAAVASPGPVALLLLDLDGFKHVNDGLGHHAGDELLRQVAGRLRGAAVPGSLLARLGGDEFAVVLRGPAALVAEEVALGVHAALQEPAVVDAHVVHAPGSVGVALGAAPGGGGDDGARALDLLRRADTAMYAAKASRAGVVAHGQHHDQRAREVLETAEDLRAALAGDQLLLHYQPQVAVADGALVGVEALLRWQHPRRGLLGPDAFLGAAHELGVLAQVTRLVLRSAVAQAAAWRDAGTPVRVSVNLSATDVQAALVADVSELLLEHALPPRLLALEITETSVVEDPAGAAAVLGDLVALGVEVSVDDFGTGHSSLTLLLQLPVAEVKVDRSFVAAVTHDHARRTVVRTTVELAHGLGMRVVAEGVEDQSVLDELAALGCDASQGYLHSRALPADQLTAWMRARAAERAGATG